MKTVYSTDSDRWAAVARHDARADGAFFYAVKTTGVFCRPSCSSRQPRRENVEFFATPDAARAAGYRDCKRCQPGGLPREMEIVNRACAVLDADPQQRLTLAQLGDAVHMSPFHLQRLFKRVVGVSPRQYQAAQRGAALRDALQRGENVTRATVDAGFGSPSRMYDTAPAELGMAPSAYRRKGAGLVVRYAGASTALGVVLVAATDRGICKIAFGDDQSELVDGLREEFANAQLIEDSTKLAPFVAQIDAYLRGSQQCVDLPLDIAPTAFQQRVWDALRRIPYGETRSYAQVAEAVGSPRAVRAVAGACASNPVALAIPCHRVLHKDGSLSGYRWGAQRKAALLDGERQRQGGAAKVESSLSGRSATGASDTGEVFVARVSESRMSSTSAPAAGTLGTGVSGAGEASVTRVSEPRMSSNGAPAAGTPGTGISAIDETSVTRISKPRMSATDTPVASASATNEASATAEANPTPTTADLDHAA